MIKPELAGVPQTHFQHSSRGKESLQTQALSFAP